MMGSAVRFRLGAPPFLGPSMINELGPVLSHPGSWGKSATINARLFSEAGHDQGDCITGHPLVGPSRVALACRSVVHPKSAKLVRRCAVLCGDGCARLAEAVGGAVLEPGCVTPFPKRIFLPKPLAVNGRPHSVTRYVMFPSGLHRWPRARRAGSAGHETWLGRTPCGSARGCLGGVRRRSSGHLAVQFPCPAARTRR